MARKTKKAEPQTDSPPVAVITQAEALGTFRDHVTGYNRQSLILACSAAVCLIVGSHSGADAISQDAMIAKLKKEVNELGLSTAQTAKYIGLSRSVVNHLMFRFKVGGPVHEVLQAINTNDAVQVVVDYLAKQRVRTLEDLSVMFNKYRRKKKAAPARGDATLVPAQAESGEHEDVHSVPMNGTTGKQGEQIMVRRGDGSTLDLYTVSSVKLVQNAISCGHTATEIGEAAIDLMTDITEISGIIEKATARGRLLQTPARAAA